MTVSPKSLNECRWYRLAIPAVALAAFIGAALLWATGLQAAVVSTLKVLGVEPGPIPFVDLHAVFSAAECQRRGLDVYLSNPCDVFGRVHVYSPLWLDLVPPILDTAAATWAGLVLILVFILALALLIRPRSTGEIAIFALAVISPMTLYAVERGNIDLVIFLLVLGAGLLQAGSRRQRFWSYAVLVGAALLKYYPAVLLALAARERRRDALLIAAGGVAALALFVAYHHDALGKALSNMSLVSADLSFYTDTFSARNLPFGLTRGLPGLPAEPLAISLFAILLLVALARVARTTTLLLGAGGDPSTTEMRFAVIGCLLATGCFLAAQNVNYRGIHLLFVLPGLLQWRTETPSATARRLLSGMVAAVLFLMWGEFFRRGLLAALDAQPGDRIPMLFWVVRELIWWWLICGLAAVALCWFAQLPLVRDGAAWLGRVRAAFSAAHRRRG